MGLEIEIVKKFEEFGIEEVIQSYTKEDIEDAISDTSKDDVKKQLKVLLSNWLAAEKFLGAIKKLAEVSTDVEEDEVFEDNWGEITDEDDWDGSYDDEEEDF